jgi:glucosamine-phosphate N-acetyltransferase
MLIRPIIHYDLDHGYLDLLSQLTNLGNGNFTSRLKEIQLNPNITILVAYDETINRVIGAGTIMIEPKMIHSCSNVAHIEDVIVDTKYISQNIGKKIIDMLITIAKVNSCYKIILNCSEKNIEFYEKCGFTNSNNNVEMSLYIK